jgi:ABC-type multidrug transport system ATPase subunit
MQIILDNVSKRYGYEWIFRNIDYTINEGDKIAVIGPNGSGKSTLIRLLLGANEPSTGKINYRISTQEIKAIDINDKFSFTGPYMDLVTNFTLSEIVKFHFSFRKIIDGMNPKEISNIALLEKSKNKEISKFSSGMQQRLKLSLALCSDSACVILDEPTTNLDEPSKVWFEELLEKYLLGRTLIIATNESRDSSLCSRTLNIAEFKSKKRS